nr:MAG TPA: hypothetical protein [Caudoviricetes sp.]
MKAEKQLFVAVLWPKILDGHKFIHKNTRALATD